MNITKLILVSIIFSNKSKRKKLLSQHETHQILRRNKQRIRKPSEISRFQRVFGPSDTIRTCDLHIPNVARYQLRYTRIFSFRYYTTPRAKIKDFPVCGQSCGQGRISARFVDPVKWRNRLCYKAFRASAVAIVDGDGNTPKLPALPTAPHRK